MLRINGKNMDEAAGQTLLGYLQRCGFNCDCIVAELNLKIVPKEEYDSTVLKDGDVLEVLNFVGGG